MKWFNPEKKDLIVLCEMIIQILNLKKNVRKQLKWVLKYQQLKMRV